MIQDTLNTVGTEVRELATTLRLSGEYATTGANFADQAIKLCQSLGQEGVTFNEIMQQAKKLADLADEAAAKAAQLDTRLGRSVYNMDQVVCFRPP
jgi:hypothetical protein